MYLKFVKIKNFRRIIDTECEFNPGLNLVVGPNDSGKTAVIDAIRITLKQVVDDYTRITEDDFNNKEQEINIDLVFSFDDSIKEEQVELAAAFAEFISFTNDGNPELRIWYSIKSDPSNIKFPEFKVGQSKETSLKMDARCRELLKVIYLRPLRDAGNELKAKQGSRISRILSTHSNIISAKDELVKLLEAFKKDTEYFFDNGTGAPILRTIQSLLKSFDEQAITNHEDIKIGPTEKLDFVKILEKIALYYPDRPNTGLGTLNMIFIAAELLHLHIQKPPKLILVEEVEAHLHPQRQLKIIKALEKEAQKGIQMILTTHSPNLSSVIDVNRLSICHNGVFFPLTSSKTKLSKENYSYLNRFLDATKANLFFTQGLILVEGTTELLLLPEFAEILGHSFSDTGISIVSTNGLGFEHFVKIFQRRDLPYNPVKVVVITDADAKNTGKIKKYTKRIDDQSNNIKCFVGEQIFEEPSKLNSSTFEMIVLMKTVHLKDLYIEEFNKRKKRNIPLTTDMTHQELYKRISKEKAPIAQLVAQRLSDLGNNEKENIKVEISQSLEYIFKAIKYITSTED